ncbi:MAG: hypothetical protein EZS28_041108 [Streblomastix strix]|uniref:Uncharacterized protein n=1 Tax=Streblomastix strix TaxID=222440 RepID=A0A5J4TY01_9EUKA|nr:MAG: hypothetical protein EZS28_041108 [Streblomastix strix]
MNNLITVSDIVQSEIAKSRQSGPSLHFKTVLIFVSSSEVTRIITLDSLFYCDQKVTLAIDEGSGVMHSSRVILKLDSHQLWFGIKRMKISNV